MEENSEKMISPLISEMTLSAVDDKMPNSHLKRSRNLKSKRTLIFSLFLLILLIIFIIVFGPQLLVEFSVLTTRINHDNANSQQLDLTPVYISVPVLEPISNATNSAKINIKGTIETNQNLQIRLFINDELADVSKIDNSGQFNFADVTLDEGINKIRAKSVFKGKESKESNTLTINFLKKEPMLEIEYPQDGSNFKSGNRTLSIKGKTDPGNKVTVNDYIAITQNDGSFEYNLMLKDGDNKIKVVANDDAGNKIEKELTVSYSS